MTTVLGYVYRKTSGTDTAGTRHLAKEADFGAVLEDCIFASVKLLCVSCRYWLQLPLMRKRAEQSIKLTVPHDPHAVAL